ncbi:Nuclear envelope morphology protein 1 [Coemansia erecta]|uniref:Nuclear envelope morphology protein 1 n=1 Tax=Coemansia erecta TaxID=147472 RepID=A0A9W7Y5W6_9FUNG|nr:Nuclear envelope morphology protein 1 [Coemansia erecta]
MIHQPPHAARDTFDSGSEQHWQEQEQHQHDEQKRHARRRFSVFYFALIYIYTQAFSLLECIPFLETLLQHLPQPQNLVSDTYQPISDKAQPPEGTSAPYSRSNLSLRRSHEADPSLSSGTIVHTSHHEQDLGASPLRRRRTSSGASNSTASSFGVSPLANTGPNASAEPSTPKRAGRGSGLAPGTPGTPGTPSSITSAGPASESLKKKTLVLDLDETLIHSSPQGSYRAHHRIEVVIDKVACLYYVYKRPHVDYFLRKVSEWYKIVIFTASMAEYADPVIDLLDSQGKYISGRYFRESCVPHDSSYAKDLAAVDPDLSQIVLVDNSPLSYFINPTNGIPIQPWINSDPKDEALLDLLPLLDALRFTDDVRSILSLRLV